MNHGLSLFLAICAPLGASATLVVNGDFETPRVVNRVAGYDLYYGGSTFTGWTVGGHSIDIVNDEDFGGNWWKPASGHQSVDLSGSGAGSISQELHTVPGQTYFLSFAMAGNPFASVVTMEFLWQGAIVDTLSFDVSHDRNDLGWKYYQYRITAASDVARLTFESLTAGVNGPAIDDVVVSDRARVLPPDTTPVPEPSTWLAGCLMLVALGGSGLRRLLA